jgi:hypothetical protein
MAGATTVYGLPFSELGDAPHGPDQSEALAEAVETELVRIDAAILTVDAKFNDKGRGVRPTSSSVSASTTLVGVLRVDSMALLSGVQYEVEYWCHPTSTVTTDAIKTEVRFSTSGSATTASSQLVESAVYTNFGSSVRWSAEYTPGSNVTASFLLCLSRAIGSGNCTLFADAAERFTRIRIRPAGLPATDTGVDA